MVTRLVLGCGTVGHALIDDLAARTGDLRVIDGDPGRVETLRNEKVAAERGDVTDTETVAAVDEQVDIVVVAGDDADQNRAAASAAREVFPDAYVLAYFGEDATGTHRAAIETTADRVVGPGMAVLDYVDDVVEAQSVERIHELREVLSGIEGTLGVFAHDNPDPDAIASAVALAAIARSLGVEAEACYFGDISHQENRALVNLLDLDLHRCEDPVEVSQYAGIALVDHSKPGVNDQLPSDTPVDVVIDHHPTETAAAAFTDVRDAVGATSTLLTDYVRQFAVDNMEAVATGLLYGIRVDTKDFRREITTQDFEAAAYLLPFADTSVLERVESPSVGADTFDTIARAIRHRQLNGSALASCTGAINDRDALAQAADRLLAMEGVTTTLVCGFTDGTIYVSARSRETDLDLGEALREAFGDIGSAGGHADMAGAQIPMGLFSDLDSEEETSLATIVGDVITTRFFEALR